MQQHPNPEYGIYKGQSQFQQDAAKVGVKSLELTKKVIDKGVSAGEDALHWAFPNASFTKNSGVSKGEKETLNEMIKSGK